MTITTYFTKQADVKTIILNRLDEASTKVLVAVAWFTDTELFQKLIELQNRGVLIELVITKHEFNNRSRNDYSLINDRGFFAEVGNDEQLMHMKFCVIDYDTVISGSANWTNKAFTENNEEVTIVMGNPIRANDFVLEFERLKEISGHIELHEEAIDLSKAFKYFNLIKAFIDLGETAKALPYIHELKQKKSLKGITDLFLEGKYDEAFQEIIRFQKAHTQIIEVSFIERQKILTQINLISYQIEMIEIKKAEAEAILEQFNHRYIIELNPLISKVLALKKKIYEKLSKHGIHDDFYEKLESDFKQKNAEYLEELKVDLPKLTEEEIADIKTMYREAVKFCHPDSTSCIYSDRTEAASIFNKLTVAYKNNNIDVVKRMWNELKMGKPADEIDMVNELDYLRLKLETLKSNYNQIFNEYLKIIESETYQLILKLDNWDDFFEEQKELLNNEIEALNKKYVHNG